MGVLGAEVGRTVVQSVAPVVPMLDRYGSSYADTYTAPDALVAGVTPAAGSVSAFTPAR